MYETTTELFRVLFSSFLFTLSIKTFVDCCCCLVRKRWKFCCSGSVVSSQWVVADGGGFDGWWGRRCCYSSVLVVVVKTSSSQTNLIRLITSFTIVLKYKHTSCNSFLYFSLNNLRSTRRTNNKQRNTYGSTNQKTTWISNDLTNYYVWRDIDQTDTTNQPAS